ncbi:unnamed protein product [Closterium sp. NIES-64]|nr:unnamed protein product [Closterium sp. NIES-64]
MASWLMRLKYVAQKCSLYSFVIVRVSADPYEAASRRAPPHWQASEDFEQDRAAREIVYDISAAFFVTRRIHEADYKGDEGRVGALPVSVAAHLGVSVPPIRQ